MRLRIVIFLLTLSLAASRCVSREEPSKMQQVLGLQKMSHLATAEYVVTKIIKANDNKTWYKIGDRKILMSCKASLVAGIDLSQLSEKDIQLAGTSISITLPRAHLLYLTIRPEDIRTAYQDVSVFRDRFSAAEKEDMAAQAERQIRASADSLGIFMTAETNATLFINQFLQKVGFKNIRIQFSSERKPLG